jgi:hypothetical protein
VREREVTVLDALSRERRDRVRERLRRGVGRSVVGDDELRGDAAPDEELRACGEARR